jgi:hypothetical protein
MLESPIQRLIPKAEDLLRMSVEQLAPILLKLAYEQRQQAGFIPRAVCDVTVSEGYEPNTFPSLCRIGRARS